MTTKKEQIKYTLEGLNLEVIQKTLCHLKIKWKDSDTGEKRIPTTEDISAVAKYCMMEAFKSEDKIFAMGGFEAEVVDGIVGIKFILTQSNTLSKLFS